MADLNDLKVALWQREARDDSPRRSRDELRSAVYHASAVGADCLVANTFECEDSPGVIPCNGATAEYGTWGMTLHTDNGDYDIGMGCSPFNADFSVRFADEGWTTSTGPRTAVDTGVPSIMVGYVGMRNAGHSVRCYDGASAVFDSDGHPIWVLRDDFEEEFRIVSLHEAGKIVEPCEHKLLQALTKTIRRFDRQVLGGSMNWVIGLSGGLDSSVVSALLVYALGKDRVLGYTLPTSYNSKATRDNAKSIAENLGIRFREVPIEDVVVATDMALARAGYGDEVLSGIVLENVQARVRGHILNTLAAVEGGVVANNGNFVECALGYATLYGDAVGALAPIADLTKVELFDLAHELNEAFGPAVIPENLLPVVTEQGMDWETMPSAELSNGQRDPMKWFYHDWLVRKLAGNYDQGAIEVIEAYGRDKLESEGMSRWIGYYGLDNAGAFISDLEWVLTKMQAAAFKRIQGIPGILVNSAQSPFGDAEVQRRWEPSERYQSLKNELLEGEGEGKE